MNIRSVQGETIEQVSLRVYGDVSMVEALYEVNRHLASYGPRLPMGVLIQTPPKTQSSTPVEAPLTLWS